LCRRKDFIPDPDAGAPRPVDFRRHV
jgi:hypothetical protein